MDAYDKEPTAADLAAIEAEWPVIEAELAVLDAEIAALTAPGGPSPLDWRRVRRAQHRALAALTQRGPAPTSVLFGGIPRMGKGFTARCLLAALVDDEPRDGAA
jgi:hypothetical protein